MKTTIDLTNKKERKMDIGETIKGILNEKFPECGGDVLTLPPSKKKGLKTGLKNSDHFDNIDSHSLTSYKCKPPKRTCQPVLIVFSGSCFLLYYPLHRQIRMIVFILWPDYLLYI